MKIIYSYVHVCINIHEEVKYPFSSRSFHCASIVDENCSTFSAFCLIGCRIQLERTDWVLCSGSLNKTFVHARANVEAWKKLLERQLKYGRRGFNKRKLDTLLYRSARILDLSLCGNFFFFFCTFLGAEHARSPFVTLAITDFGTKEHRLHSRISMHFIDPIVEKHREITSQTSMPFSSSSL